MKKERERDRRSPLLIKWMNKTRCLIKTVGSQLMGRFHIETIRVRNMWHFQSRLIRKILSHTVAVFLNLKLGREPLDFDSLVIV